MFGLTASNIAAAKWRSGKNQPSLSSHSGMRAVTRNTSETNANVISRPLVSAWTAVAPGTSETTARPRAANAATPSRSVTTAAGRPRHTTSTP
jgi:hypothetical protein